MRAVLVHNVGSTLKSSTCPQCQMIPEGGCSPLPQLGHLGTVAQAGHMYAYQGAQERNAARPFPGSLLEACNHSVTVMHHTIFQVGICTELPSAAGIRKGQSF